MYLAKQEQNKSENHRTKEEVREDSENEKQFMESTEVQQIEKQENESDISEMRKKAEEETEENSKEEQEFIVNNAADEQEQASEIDKPQTEEKIDEGTQEKQKEEQKLNEKDGIMAKNFGEEERKVKSILSPGTVFDYKGIVFSLFRLIFFISKLCIHI